MRRKKWSLAAALALAAFGASKAQAQVPAATATNGTTAAAATAAAGEAKPGFFKKCCQAIEDCKRKLCKTAAGQLLNSMTAPVSALTGGVIPSFCPAMPSAADLLKSGVDGAAANAKKDALEAKERVKAVRYLGTLDCRYYPEAEAALIAALRMDRVECVRWEAAMAFGGGCCCTKKVIEALDVSVSGSDKDGNPGERSERVREAAFMALNHCLACYRETPKEVEDKDIKEKPPADKKEESKVTSTTKPAKNEREYLDRARQTVALYSARRESAMPGAMPVQQTVLPKGQRSLYHIIRFGAEGPTQPAAQPVTQQIVRQVPKASPIVYPAPAPREMPRVQTIPAAQPLPRERSGTTIVAPQPKPIAPVAAVEPMELTPPPMTIKFQPESAPEAPVAPMTLNLRPENPPEAPVAPMTLTLQPASQTAPASIEKPLADERSISTLIDDMLTGTTPNDRHQAVRAMVGQDWRKHPQIVAALVKTARIDSDRAVRVSAIRHLAALKIDLPYVVDHLKYMQKDQDEWVSQESTAALEKFAK